MSPKNGSPDVLVMSSSSLQVFLSEGPPLQGHHQVTTNKYTPTGTGHSLLRLLVPRSTLHLQRCLLTGRCQRPRRAKAMRHHEIQPPWDGMRSSEAGRWSDRASRLAGIDRTAASSSRRSQYLVLGTCYSVRSGILTYALCLERGLALGCDELEGSGLAVQVESRLF